MCPWRQRQELLARTAITHPLRFSDRSQFRDHIEMESKKVHSRDAIMVLRKAIVQIHKEVNDNIFFAAICRSYLSIS